MTSTELRVLRLAENGSGLLPYPRQDIGECPNRVRHAIRAAHGFRARLKTAAIFQTLRQPRPHHAAQAGLRSE
jgi:hypothetical protein